MDSTNAANESQLHEASMDRDNIYVRMRSLAHPPIYILEKYRVG